MTGNNAVEEINARWRDQWSPAGSPAEELAGKPSFERAAGYRTLLKQGLRLHRAFFGIRDSAIREAIIDIVLETQKTRSAE